MTYGIFIYTAWGKLKNYEMLKTENQEEAVTRYNEVLNETPKTMIVYLTKAGKNIEREHLHVERGLNERYT